MGDVVRVEGFVVSGDRKNLLRVLAYGAVAAVFVLSLVLAIMQAPMAYAASPASPEYLGGADAGGATNSGTVSANFGSTLYERNIAVEGDYAYVIKGGSASDCASAREGCELQIYDISNPTTPVYVTGFDASGTEHSGTSADNIFATYVMGDYLYFAKAVNSTNCNTVGNKAGCELQIFDISDPASPVYVTGIDADGTVGSGTSSATSFTHLTGHSDHLYIGKTGNATDCATVGNKAGCELSIYNVTDPSAPTAVANFDISGARESGTASSNPMSMSTDGTTLAFVRPASSSQCNNEGDLTGCEVYLFDVSVPSITTFRAGIDSSGAVDSGTGNQIVYSAVIENEHLYFAKAGSAIPCDSVDKTGCETVIYDISNPSSPTVASGIDSSSTVDSGAGQTAVYSVDVTPEGLLLMASAGSSLNCSNADKSGCELKIFAAGDLPVWEGSGTEESPYQITDCEELQAINDAEPFASAYYILMNDIDCSETVEWNDGEGFEPIGRGWEFRGSFDGNSHSVTDLYVSRASDDVMGLFGYIDEDGIVFDLGVEDADITGDQAVGALGGVVYGTIERCFSTGIINGSDEVGGLVGGHNGWDTIEDSYSTADVTGEWAVGGLAGSNYGNIYRSYATGAVVSTGNTAGGLVGNSSAWDESMIEIHDSYATGTVTASAYAGGLVGYAYNTEVLESYAEGTVSGSDNSGWSGEYLGGLIGEADESLVEDSYATGDVVVEGDGDVASTGGLIGYADEAEVFGSYAEGMINIPTAEMTGGLVGYAYESDISQSYASGDVDGDYSVGGLVGESEYTYVSESFALGDVTGNEYTGGLVGYLDYEDVSDSYARGNVNGGEYGYTGGLIGYMSDGSFYSSYSTGAVTAGGEANNVGGLVGSGWDDVLNSFWDTQTSGQAESDAGTGKTSSQMKNIATYTSLVTEGLDEPWDFEGMLNDDEGDADIWFISTSQNDGYPCLSWQGEYCSATTPGGEAVDHNGDGIVDSEQPHVTSVTSPISGKTVVLEVDDACTVESMAVKTESTNTVQDSGFSYPAGLMNFTVDCGSDGYTTTVKQYFYGVNPTGLTARKHNPSTGAYFTITGAALSAQTINGHITTLVTFQITDGGTYDIDGQLNGVIVDPAGLAQSATTVPNTGFRQ